MPSLAKRIVPPWWSWKSLGMQSAVGTGQDDPATVPTDTVSDAREAVFPLTVKRESLAVFGPFGSLALFSKR